MMTFVWIALAALAVLGVIAALASWGDTDNVVVISDGDCSACTGKADCKLAGLRQGNKCKNDVAENASDMQ